MKTVLWQTTTSEITFLGVKLSIIKILRLNPRPKCWIHPCVRRKTYVTIILIKIWKWLVLVIGTKLFKKRSLFKTCALRLTLVMTTWSTETKSRIWVILVVQLTSLIIVTYKKNPTEKLRRGSSCLKASANNTDEPMLIGELKALQRSIVRKNSW